MALLYIFPRVLCITMDQGFNGLENEMAKGNDKTTPLQKMDNAVCRRKSNMKVAHFEMGTTYYLEPILRAFLKYNFKGPN